MNDELNEALEELREALAELREGIEVVQEIADDLLETLTK